MTSDPHTYYEQHRNPDRLPPAPVMGGLSSDARLTLRTPPLPQPADGCRCRAKLERMAMRDILVPCVEQAGADGLCPRCSVECTQPTEEAAA